MPLLGRVGAVLEDEAEDEDEGIPDEAVLEGFMGPPIADDPGAACAGLDESTNDDGNDPAISNQQISREENS